MDSTKFLYRVEEAAASLGVSKRTVTYLITGGDLATKKIGSRTLITRASLQKYANSDHPGPVKKRLKAEVISRPNDISECA